MRKELRRKGKYYGKAVIVLKDGVEVARTVGFQPKDAMRSFIEEHLN